MSGGRDSERDQTGRGEKQECLMNMDKNSDTKLPCTMIDTQTKDSNKRLTCTTIVYVNTPLRTVKRGCLVHPFMHTHRSGDV